MGLNILSCATVGFQLQDILARALGQIERHCEGLAGRCGRSLNGSVTLLSGCGWWGGWLSGGAGDTFYIEECILVHKTLYIHTYIHTHIDQSNGFWVMHKCPKNSTGYVFTTTISGKRTKRLHMPRPLVVLAKQIMK